MPSITLHDFIAANRETIIERARLRVSERTAPRSTDTKLTHGVPLFLTQLVRALAELNPTNGAPPVSETARQVETIADSATLHGRDLLKNGLTVAQVVNGYGDVCQVVTELASEANGAISVEDFNVFNRCLDEAIAGAVSAYGTQKESDLAYEGTERLGILVHELRNLLNTATLSFAIIKKGKVGVDGSTGAILARSLSSLSALVDRSVAAVRLESGPPKLERFAVTDFIDEIEVSAAMQAAGNGRRLTVDSGERDVAINADWQLLSSAVLNLLQNAFKFSRGGGCVALTTHASAERVLIEVADECGGLPPGKAEELFQPFTRRSADRSGLGLGLTIAQSAARANAGDLYVRDVPGTGCVFTIDLPRASAVEPSREQGPRGSDGTPLAGAM